MKLVQYIREAKAAGLYPFAPIQRLAEELRIFEIKQRAEGVKNADRDP